MGGLKFTKWGLCNMTHNIYNLFLGNIFINCFFVFSPQDQVVLKRKKIRINFLRFSKLDRIGLEFDTRGDKQILARCVVQFLSFIDAQRNNGKDIVV